MVGCTCLPRSPDDQCPSHGYEEWLKSGEAPVLTPHEKDTLDRHITGSSDDAFSEYGDEEWLSTCCGAPPGRAAPDVGEDNQAGICSQCREHTGFERGKDGSHGLNDIDPDDPCYGADPS